MAQPVRCDISAGVILRWRTKTRSAVLKNIRQDSLLKQMLENDFWTLLRSENSIVKFTDTIYSCSVVISSRYNLGVNMSVSQHAQVMCSFRFPCPLKAMGSFSMRSPSEINSKYLCTASKGAYIADSTSSNKYWRKCWGGILLIDAVLFPF